MSVSKLNKIDNSVIICKFCEKQIKALGFSTHILVKHGLHSKEYYDKFLKTENEDICKTCGKQTKFINLTNGYRTYCCALCARRGKESTKLASETWHSHGKDWEKQVIEKSKNTYFERTGYTHNWSNPESRERCIQTYYEKTGYKHNMQNPEHIKERQDKYEKETGYRHNWSNPELREAAARRRFERTGYYYYNQDPKYSPSGKIYGFYENNIWFDSRWEYNLYQALIKSNNIFEYHPKIVFKYFKNNKVHVYHPDFLINGKFYEVKGDFFFNENGQLWNPFTKELNIEKYQCMIDNNIIILKQNELNILIDKINSGFLI